MLLFYIRHGDPIYNPNQLTPLGARQAEAVAKRLALYGVDHIYSSDSNRAVETAKPTAELLKKEIELLPWCNESLASRDFMIRNSEQEIRQWCWSIPQYRLLFNSPEIRALGDKWYTHPTFADTNFEQGFLRVQRETDALLEKHGYVHDPENHCYIAKHPNDERIALFAHQGFGMLFMSCLLDIPYPIYSTHFDLGHSNFSVIEFSNKEGCRIPKVLQSSNDSHLYREGLPTNYQNRIKF